MDRFLLFGVVAAFLTVVAGNAVAVWRWYVAVERLRRARVELWEFRENADGNGWEVTLIDHNNHNVADGKALCRQPPQLIAHDGRVFSRLGASQTYRELSICSIRVTRHE